MACLRTNVFVEGAWYGPAHGAVVSDDIAAKVDPDLLEPEPEPEPVKPKPAPAKAVAAKKK